MPQSSDPKERRPPDPESFIPLSRRQLVDRLLADDRLSSDERGAFRRFCEIFAALVHHQLHSEVEEFKSEYAHVSPDGATEIVPSSAVDVRDAGGRVAERFRRMVLRANYREISRAELERALVDHALVDVRTKVNLDDFDEIVTFCRGDVWSTATVKRFFRTREIDVDVLERVALLLKFKPATHFQGAGDQKRVQQLSFQPGKVYLYLYKNVPKNDLELLFPNVKISMNWRHRLLVGVPATGAAVLVLTKMVPKLLIIAGVIAFFTMGPGFAEKLGVDREAVSSFMPVALAGMALAIAFGGLAARQYNSFKNKTIKFQKDVSDTLFFRNVATNVSVFHRLVDQAEEAECKEAILVVYHLLVNRSGKFTAEQLDAEIERWLIGELGSAVDFDIEEPIAILQQIQGDDGAALLERDAEGHCQTSALDLANRIVAEAWSRSFDADMAG